MGCCNSTPKDAVAAPGKDANKKPGDKKNEEKKPLKDDVETKSGAAIDEAAGTGAKDDGSECSGKAEKERVKTEAEVDEDEEVAGGGSGKARRAGGGGGEDEEDEDDEEEREKAEREENEKQREKEKEKEKEKEREAEAGKARPGSEGSESDSDGSEDGEEEGAEGGGKKKRKKNRKKKGGAEGEGTDDEDDDDEEEARALAEARAAGGIEVGTGAGIGAGTGAGTNVGLGLGPGPEGPEAAGEFGGVGGVGVGAGAGAGSASGPGSGPEASLEAAGKENGGFSAATTATTATLAGGMPAEGLACGEEDDEDFDEDDESEYDEDDDDEDSEDGEGHRRGRRKPKTKKKGGGAGARGGDADGELDEEEAVDGPDEARGQRDSLIDGLTERAAAAEKEVEALRQKMQETTLACTLIPSFQAKQEPIMQVMSGGRVTVQGRSDYFDGLHGLLKSPENWGVQARLLIEFCRDLITDLEAWCSLTRQRPDMKSAVERYVKPWFQPYSDLRLARGEGLATVLAVSDGLDGYKGTFEDTIKAKTFIAHSWSQPFVDFVKTLEKTFVEEEVVWVSSFSMSPFTPSNIQGSVLEDAPFWQAMQHCQLLTIFADNKGEAFQRSWCGFEIYLASQRAHLPTWVAFPGRVSTKTCSSISTSLGKYSFASTVASSDVEKKWMSEAFGRLPDDYDTAVREEIRKGLMLAQLMNQVPEEDGAAAPNGKKKKKKRKEKTPSPPEPADGKKAKKVKKTKKRASAHISDAMQACALLKDSSGKSMLHLCVLKNNQSLVKLLAQDPSLVTAASNDGKAALHLACEKEDATLVRMLLASKADPNALSAGGNTPLHFGYLNLAVAEMLVNAGATIGAANTEGDTPLILAAAAGKADVVQYLVICGANKGAKNKKGESALSIARENGDKLVLAVLQE